MPRLICSTEIPYPVESCVTTMLKMHRNLFENNLSESIDESIMDSISCYMYLQDTQNINSIPCIMPAIH